MKLIYGSGDIISKFEEDKQSCHSCIPYSALTFYTIKIFLMAGELFSTNEMLTPDKPPTRPLTFNLINKQSFLLENIW